MSRQSEKDRIKADSELFGLLESLLSEVDGGAEAAPPPQQPQDARPFAEPPPAPATLLVEPVADLFQQVLEETGTKTLNKTEQRPLEKPETETQPPPSRRPVWAQTEFSTLVFQVNGQKLAIPVLDLAGVVPCAGDITPMPGQPSWHMGVQKHRGGKMVAVDLTQLLQLKTDADAQGKGCYLLAVGEGRFGLRCDGIPEPVKVDPDDVRWSGDSEGRGLLAGILSKQMCPLLNVKNILLQLGGA